MRAINFYLQRKNSWWRVSTIFLQIFTILSLVAILATNFARRTHWRFFADIWLVASAFYWLVSVTRSQPSLQGNHHMFYLCSVIVIFEKKILKFKNYLTIQFCVNFLLNLLIKFSVVIKTLSERSVAGVN